MVKAITSGSRNTSISFAGNNGQKHSKVKETAKFIAKEAVTGATVGIIFDTFLNKGLGVANILKRAVAFSAVWVAMGMAIRGIDKLFTNKTANK